MATFDGDSILKKRRGDFFHKMELAKAEIQDKFRGFHEELCNKEAKLIRVIEKIWDDTLVKLKQIRSEFEEIENIKNITITTVTSNSNKEFLEAQVDACNKKIDELIGKSGIDKVIELKWRNIGLQIGNICRIKANICVDLETQRIIDFESNEASLGTESSLHTTQPYVGRSHSLCDQSKNPFDDNFMGSL